ncbi:MAG: hypothetical protein RR513_05720 [Muribaculaceae bacterium]
MAFEKIDIEFCLSDDSVNVYGYRMLTSGFDLERYRPPIGYLMHDRDKGVALKWEDFRIGDGKLYAKPVVNTTNFPDLVGLIRDGFYAAASVGKIVAIEISDDDKYRLEGQTGPTVLKWFPRECSIVDIPGNYSALAQLYDESDNVLRDLSEARDLPTNNNKKMDKEEWTPADLALLDLADGASGADIREALHNLADRAKRCDTAETALADLRKKIATDKVTALLSQGLADRKLTQAMRDKLSADYAERPAELQALIDTLPSQTLITPQIGDVPSKYAGKTWHDLYLSDELAEVKKSYPDLYDKLKNER